MKEKKKATLENCVNTISDHMRLNKKLFPNIGPFPLSRYIILKVIKKYDEIKKEKKNPDNEEIREYNKLINEAREYFKINKETESEIIDAGKNLPPTIYD